MKYELEVTILADDVDKRQKLAARIDMALALGGCRITAGEYDVIIERKSARRLRAEAQASVSPEAPEAAPERETCPECGGDEVHDSCLDAMAARRDVSNP